MIMILVSIIKPTISYNIIMNEPEFRSHCSIDPQGRNLPTWISHLFGYKKYRNRTKMASNLSGLMIFDTHRFIYS